MFYVTPLVLGIHCLLAPPIIHWSYHGKTGPSHWCELLGSKGSCCGKYQSPINIDRKKVKYTYQFLNLTDLNTWYEPMMNLTNNGHTIELRLNMNSRNKNVPRLILQNCRDEERVTKDVFYFDSLHFHFGAFSDRGSEHIIDHKTFPLEITMKANKIMELLTEKLPEIAYEQQNTTIPAIPLRYFLPYNINKFYTYQGSLTAPPCLETATWYILKQKMPISEIQMARFRQLTKRPFSGQIIDGLQHNSVEYPFLSDNFRPLQLLNGRTVYENINAPKFCKI